MPTSSLMPPSTSTLDVPITASPAAKYLSHMHATQRRTTGGFQTAKSTLSASNHGMPVPLTPILQPPFSAIPPNGTAELSQRSLVAHSPYFFPGAMYAHPTHMREFYATRSMVAPMYYPGHYTMPPHMMPTGAPLHATELPSNYSYTVPCANSVSPAFTMNISSPSSQQVDRKLTPEEMLAIRALEGSKDEDNGRVEDNSLIRNGIEKSKKRERLEGGEVEDNRPMSKRARSDSL